MAAKRDETGWERKGWAQTATRLKYDSTENTAPPRPAIAHQGNKRCGARAVSRLAQCLAETKAKQEAQIWEVVEATGAELVILARYMQVLSSEMCERLSGRAINIHHSLLPGFKGARPYHQAYEKGVKLVGATAHYINDDLDEGPIITQGVEPVSHTDYPEDMVSKGRDVECLTLARAVALHVERRVFLHAKRTVVFDR